MHMKIQIYSLVLTFVLLLIPHTGTVNTKLPITLEAANAQLKGNGPTISEHENGKIVENITFGSSLEYTEIEIEKAGTYKFDIKYLTGDTNRPMSITITTTLSSSNFHKQPLRGEIRLMPIPQQPTCTLIPVKTTSKSLR